LPDYSILASNHTMKKGILYGAGAYIFWGIFPIYFKLLHNVPAIQIVSHRVFWSVVLLLGVVALRKELGALRRSATPRVVLLYLIAGVLLAANWGVYVWAVNSGFVVDASLGYFINPLVSVLLGVLFLREKLRPLQWVPVGIAAVGVLYLTFSYGQLPWIGLVLAFTFGLYGLMKKLAPLNSLHGLTYETVLVLLPALGYLLFVEFTGGGAFGHISWLTSLLLAFTGVMTVVPLLMFANGVQLIPLSVMGILQYIAPTLQFLSGVVLFNESLTHDRIIGFGIIWLAIILFSGESLLRRQPVVAPAPME
jgi:chloramphenicol-sensitive protein RarD